MAERKSEFWWASIHGADPESVEKVTINGRPAVYTCGCADPFYLDENPCPVLLVSEMKDRPFHPDRERQMREEQQRKADAIWKARDAGHKTFVWNGVREAVPPWHGWRGPR